MTSRGTEIPYCPEVRLTILLLTLSLLAPLSKPVLATATAGTHQDARSTGSWLDRPLVNWNAKSSELPAPVISLTSVDVRTRCPNLIREADRPVERELARAGWLLYGAVQSYGLTKVVTAMSGADAMCRPLGHQAFVYWDGAYAGTLSPAAMDSRTNGALMHFHLVSATRISAEFARYREADAACCPTRISYVSYEISGENAPIVSPVEITTMPVATAVETPGVDNSLDDTAQLYEKKWKLMEMGQAVITGDNPYISFERDGKRFSGNGGCNIIAGRFAVEGRQLKLSLAVSTRMACLDSKVQQVETEFLEALEHTTRFQLQGDSLRLYDWGSLLLVFQSDSGEVSGAPQETRVTGTVTYSQRGAFSEAAVLEVKLVDVTRANIPAATIAEHVIKLAGKQPPITFELSYEPTRIEDDHRYVVQAQVLENGRRRLAHTRVYPVITMGNPKTANIALRSVRR